MSQLKDFTLRLVAGANIVTIIIMLLLGYSDRVDAAAHPFIGVIGLAFPVFLVLNILFLLFWLCVRKRWAVIPLLGLIAGYGPISTYSPLSIVLIIKQMLLLLRRQAVIARPSDLVQNAVGLLLILLLAGVIIPVGVAGT